MRVQLVALMREHTREAARITQEDLDGLRLDPVRPGRIVKLSPSGGEQGRPDAQGSDLSQAAESSPKAGG